MSALTTTLWPSSFPPAWRFHLQDPSPNRSHILPLHMPKPSQSRLSLGLQTFLPVLSPSNILISNPVHLGQSQRKIAASSALPLPALPPVFVSTTVSKPYNIAGFRHSRLNLPFHTRRYPSITNHTSPPTPSFLHTPSPLYHTLSYFEQLSPSKTHAVIAKESRR